MKHLHIYLSTASINHPASNVAYSPLVNEAELQRDREELRLERLVEKYGTRFAYTLLGIKRVVRNPREPVPVEFKSGGRNDRIVKED